MDQPWNASDWDPTVACPHWAKPPASHVLHNCNVVKVCSRRISDTPYDPDNWYLRGDALLQLGYPELAAGDAHKACLLVDAGLDYDSAFGENVRLQFGMSVWFRDHDAGSWRSNLPTSLFRVRISHILLDIQEKAYTVIVESLGYLQSPWDSLRLCQEAAKKFPNQPLFIQTQLDAKEGLQHERKKLEVEAPTLSKRDIGYELRFGRVKMKRYPWIPSRYLSRNEEIIRKVNKELQVSGPKCIVSPSPLGVGQLNQDVLGMFASKTILAGETVLVDRTTAGVTNITDLNTCGNCCSGLSHPQRTTCCEVAVFCSSECRDLALAHYHPVICGKDFSWLYESAKRQTAVSPEMVPLVFLRLLAACVRQNHHPLELPTIAQLTPSYGTNHPCGWTIGGNVIEPIRILQTLGIDVFADLRYDTWVLQTMWFRILNNKCSDLETKIPISAINPLFSFLNHSCDPNTSHVLTGSSTKALMAVRDIKKGEEIFTSYLGDQSLPRQERRRRLMPWLGKPCCCLKCKRGD